MVEGRRVYESSKVSEVSEDAVGAVALKGESRGRLQSLHRSTLTG
jgi:hypothetical protein